MGLLELLLQGRVEEFNASRGRYAAPDLFAADLSGLCLQGVDLSGANLEKADLSGTDLSNAVLVNTNLSSSDLTGANLSGVVGLKSKWRDAYLGEANLEAADFTRADFSGADLTGVNGAGVNLSQSRMKDADFCNCNLPDADLQGSVLTGSRFRGARLPQGQFQEAQMTRADMEGAHLEDCDFSGAHLPGVNARAALLTRGNFKQADLTGAILEDADLESAIFFRADLSGAKVKGAHMRFADFREARMDEVGLEAADTQGAVFSHTRPTETRATPMERVPLHFGDVLTCHSSDAVGILWENEDQPETAALRVAVAPLSTPWDGAAPELGEPADLVIARTLMPGPLGFLALLFVERPGGLVCRLTEVSVLGDVGATRTVPFEYVPAVKPVFVPDSEGFLVYGLGRRGPSLHAHRYNSEGFASVYRERVPTARGFVGNAQPVILCKGGVVLPVTPRGLEQPLRCPEGFPGRRATACRLGEGTFLGWLEPGRQGFMYTMVQPGILGATITVDPANGVSSLDAAAFDDRVLVVYTRDGNDPLSPTGLWGVWLPDGRPFLIHSDDEDLEEALFVANSPTPLVTAVTLGGGVRVVAVKREKGHLMARLGP